MKLHARLVGTILVTFHLTVAAAPSPEKSTSVSQDDADQTPPAPAVESGAGGQEAQLQTLLQAYLANEISPEEYQTQRAKIIGGVSGDDARRRLGSDTVEAVSPEPIEVAGAVIADLPEPVAAPAGGGASSSGSNSAGPIAAALVPGADMLLRIDFKSVRQSPIYAALKKAQEQNKSNQDNPADLTKAAQELEEKLGLKEEDIESILLSADLDNVKAAGGEKNPLADSQGLLAIKVSRNVSLSQIESALKTMAKEGDETKEIQISKVKIAGHDALSVAPQKENDPPLFISVHDGKTVFLGMNQDSLSGAFSRTDGQAAAMEPALNQVMNSIPGSSQIKLSFVVPPALRQTLQGMAGGGNQAEPGPGAMLAGFTDIRSLSLSMNLSDKVAVNLSGDLGSAEAAQGLNMMLSLLKPQMMAGLAKKAGKTPQQMPADALVTTLKGQVLTIALLFDQELIAALRAPSPEQP